MQRTRESKAQQDGTENEKKSNARAEAGNQPRSGI
jgi:hypothetical protein